MKFKDLINQNPGKDYIMHSGSKIYKKDFPRIIELQTKHKKGKLTDKEFEEITKLTSMRKGTSHLKTKKPVDNKKRIAHIDMILKALKNPVKWK